VIYLREAHKSYYECRRILTIRLPFLGLRDLCSWDVSGKRSMAAKVPLFQTFLTVPKEQLD
jgi:hypothetical protein